MNMGREIRGCARIADYILDVGALVERGVFHDDYGLYGKLGEQVLSDPGIKTAVLTLVLNRPTVSSNFPTRPLMVRASAS